MISARLIYFVLFCATCIAGIAQPRFCGTQLTETPYFDLEAFDHFQQRRSIQRNKQAVQLGITIHIVEEVAGAANIDIEKLYSELDQVNRYFNSSGLQFYFCGSPRTIIGNRARYTYQSAAVELNQNHHVPNTINIFYLDEISDPQLSFAACGISTFPFASRPEDRFIIMQKGCSTNGSILAHEIGHFFGLLHTHETFRGVELVNGSNCETAGDLICDTPADPNISLVGLSGCTWTAQVADPNGDIYNPDPSNIMSYAPAACAQRFSPTQDDVMNFWYETELSYLLTNCDFYPDFVIKSEVNDMDIVSGQQLNLSFDLDNQGITEDYQLEVHFLLQQQGDALVLTIHKDTILIPAGSNSISANFQFEFPLARGSGDYLLTAFLDPDGTVLERDKRNNLHTIHLTVDNSNFSDRVVFPNPVNDFMRVFVRDRTLGGDVFLEIADLQGRQYSSQKQFKNDEELFVNVDVAGLRPGVYVLTLLFIRDDEKQSHLFIKN